MGLIETIEAAGMTPPREIVAGKWARFPGIGKGRSNRSGWCRLITPALAIYGDWSSNLSAVWHDSTYQDSAENARLLADARRREQEFVRQQRERQLMAAEEAERLIQKAIPSHHPYLTRKGFPDAVGLVKDEKLLIPMRDVDSYRDLISVQEITAEGDKRFLTGSRTRKGIYRLGAPDARRVALCEGYATGLSLQCALQRLGKTACVVVCFSAMNLVAVSKHFPTAAVCADNDISKTGEESARMTGLPWCMPAESGHDFNDMHQQQGLMAVINALRGVFQ